MLLLVDVCEWELDIVVSVIIGVVVLYRNEKGL